MPWSRRFMLAALAGLLVSSLAGCARHPELAPPPLPAARELAVEIDPVTGVHSVELTVLSYNVGALPFPQRTGAGRAMRRIEQAWDGEFAGEAPDILLLQEAFVPSATRLAGRSGWTGRTPAPTGRNAISGGRGGC